MWYKAFKDEKYYDDEYYVLYIYKKWEEISYTSGSPFIDYKSLLFHS